MVEGSGKFVSAVFSEFFEGLYAHRTAREREAFADGVSVGGSFFGSSAYAVPLEYVLSDDSGFEWDEEYHKQTVEELRQEVTRKLGHKKVFGYPLPADADEDFGGWCGDCGSVLQIVRPGKWQCVRC